MSRELATGAIIAGALGGSRPDLGLPPQVCSTQAVNAGESELMEPGGGVTSKMLTPRRPGDSDCNACHTAAGLNAAPGRIVAP